MVARTWRNVNAPKQDTSGTELALKASTAAGESFEGAVQGMADREADVLQKEKTLNTETARAAYRGATTPEELAELDVRYSPENLAGQNIDLAKVSEFGFKRGGDVLKKTRADLQYTQQQDERTQRLTDAETARGRATEAYKDTRTDRALVEETRRIDKSAQQAVGNVFTNRQREATNVQAFVGARDQIGQFDPDLASLFAIDDAGNVTPDPSVTPHQFEEFMGLAESLGAAPYQSLGDKIEQLEASNLPANVLAKAVAQLRTRHDETKLDKDELSQLASKTAETTGNIESGRQVLKDALEVELSRIKPNQTKSAEENTQDRTTLEAHILSTYDDGVVDLDYYGGNNLVTMLTGLMDQGIPVDGKTMYPEPWMISKHLASQSKSLDSEIFDAGVSKKGITKALKAEMLLGLNEGSITYSDSLRKKYVAEEQKLRDDNRAALKKFTRTLKRAAGVTDTSKNINIFNR